jgi:membrane protease YdiL (CAAX protease family)
MLGAIVFPMKQASWRTVLGITFGPAAAAFLVSSALIARYGNDFFNLYVWFIPILQLVFFAIAVVALRSRGSSLRAVVQFQRTALRRDLAIGAAIFLAGFAIIMAYVLVMSYWIPSIVRPSLGFASALFTVLVGAVSAGICEEVIWRGYCLPQLETLTNSWTKAALISSLGFSLWHVNPFMMPYTFAVGLFYSYVYIRLRRLFPLMFGHWLTDFLGFLAYL